MISLDEYVLPQLVRIDVAAADRDALLAAFVELVRAEGLVEEPSVERLRAALCNRELIGSTGIGEGVALPHAYLPGVRRSLLACIRLRAPIDYEAPDLRPVDLAFLIAGPTTKVRDHLEVLGHLARMLRDLKGRDELRKATTPKEFLRALMELDARQYGT